MRIVTSHRIPITLPFAAPSETTFLSFLKRVATSALSVSNPTTISCIVRVAAYVSHSSVRKLTVEATEMLCAPAYLAERGKILIWKTRIVRMHGESWTRRQTRCQRRIGRKTSDVYPIETIVFDLRDEILNLKKELIFVHLINSVYGEYIPLMIN